MMNRVRAGSSGSSAVHESQLIGSILAEDEDALRERERPSMGDVKDPIGHRSTSAPPQLAMLDNQSQIAETLLPDDLRLSPEYYTYYYSQKPLDPRLPPPIFNWSSWHYANSRRGGPGGGDRDFLIRAGLKLGDLAALSKEKASSAVPEFASAAPSMSPMLSGSGVGIDEATADYILRSKGALFSAASSTSSSPHLQSLQSRPDLYEDGLDRRELEHRLSYGERERECETFGSPAISAETGAELRERIASISLAPRLGAERRPETGSLDGRLDLGSRAGFERALSASVPNSGGSGRLGHFGAQSASFSAGTGGFPPSVAQALFPSMGMPFTAMGGIGALGASRPPRPLGGLGSLAGQTARPTPGNLGTNPSPMMAVMGYGHLGHAPPRPQGSPETLSPSLAASLASLSLTERRPGDALGPLPGSSLGTAGNGVQEFRGGPPPSFGGGGGSGPAFGRRPPWGGDQRPETGGFRGSPRSPRGGAVAGARHSVPRVAKGRGRGGGGGSAPAFGPPFPPPGGAPPPGTGLGVPGPGAPPGTALDAGSRSAWLDDFRLNKANTNLSLKDVVSRGLMLELATDQYGSRFIQQRLESATADEKQAAFEQLLPETLRLCTDVFGNYVIQKFFEFGIFEHKKILASKLVGNVLMLSLQMYGCRVVQKAIDVSDVETQALLVRELTGHVMECVKDQNGNHVIQKCIEKVPPYLIGFIVEAFSHQIFNLSTHPYGCRVIQRLLENCSESQRNAILSEILENVEDLCKNQYGNYVIQHVLIHGTPWHRGAIIRAVRGKILPLSKHKFASNVIEKCFAHASRQHRAVLVEEVLGKEDRDPTKTPLISMVKDQYANYVVQKMVDVVDEEQRAMILHRIKRHVPNLRKIPYGKHIIARIEKLTGKPILP